MSPPRKAALRPRRVCEPRAMLPRRQFVFAAFAAIGVAVTAACDGPGARTPTPTPPSASTPDVDRGAAAPSSTAGDEPVPVTTSASDAPASTDKPKTRCLQGGQRPMRLGWLRVHDRVRAHDAGCGQVVLAPLAMPGRVCRGCEGEEGHADERNVQRNAHQCRMCEPPVERHRARPDVHRLIRGARERETSAA